MRQLRELIVKKQSLFTYEAKPFICIPKGTHEESLEGKTISKKNQALIKVRILNLREKKMKAYENRIVQGPQTEG